MMRWVSLGDYIEQCDERNSSAKYTVESVKGVSINKILIDTKADMTGVSLLPYKIVRPKEFVFVTITSRNGGKISLAMNNDKTACIVSSSYEVFRVINPLELLPDYLYLWFCRPEFDRYARFNSWGSAREAFSYEDMERVQIPLLGIDEQRKIVSVWKGLRDLKVQNEVIAEPLFELCQSYLKQLKEEYEPTEIGPYIEEVNEKNAQDNIHDVMGLNVNKEFREPQSRVDKTKLQNYKILRNNQFAYVPTTDTWRCLAVALSKFEKDIVVSPIYVTFKIRDEGKLVPEYLYVWLKQKETDRWARYNSWGSARENLNFEDLCRFEIPIPSPEKQRAIVNIYNCAKEAKDIANKTDQLIKDICPALMRQVIGEAS